MTELPDPRPQVRSTGDVPRLEGWRCVACRRPVALHGPWCPYCRGDLEPTAFGPGGTTWAATVLRVALPGRPAPSHLVYVDLDDGPRVLGHVAGPAVRRLRVGDRVRLVGSSETGDPLFEPDSAQEAA